MKVTTNLFFGNRKLRNIIAALFIAARCIAQSLRRLRNIYGDCSLILTKGMVNINPSGQDLSYWTGLNLLFLYNISIILIKIINILYKNNIFSPVQ